MSRPLKLLVVALLIALVPLRAIAAATMPCCASSGEPQVEMAVGEAHCHEHEPESSANPDGCGFCAAHCTGAMPVAPHAAAPQPVVARGDRIVLDIRALPGYVPERLERPPLVS